MYCTTTEVRRRASGGSGSGGSATATALPDAELRALIEQASRYFDLACGVKPGYFESAYHPVWESTHPYEVGDIVTPTTRNSHIYRVTTAGTSGASEPTFPTSSAATVISGTVTFTEHGADVVASSRVCRGNGTNYIQLDPYVPSSLTITYPEGYTLPTYDERDGYLIFTSGNFGPPFIDSVGWYQGIAITASAIWGFDGVPSDVKAMIIEFVINLWRETDPAAVKLINLEGQPLREKMPPRVWELCRRYRAKGVAFV